MEWDQEAGLVHETWTSEKRHSQLRGPYGEMPDGRKKTDEDHEELKEVPQKKPFAKPSPPAKPNRSSKEGKPASKSMKKKDRRGDEDCAQDDEVHEVI